MRRSLLRIWSYRQIQRNNNWLRLIWSLLNGTYSFFLSSQSFSDLLGNQSQLCLLSGQALQVTNIPTLHQSSVTMPPAWTACGSRIGGSAGRRTRCRGLRATPDVWPEGSFTSPAPSASSSWPERWLVRWKKHLCHKWLHKCIRYLMLG